MKDFISSVFGKKLFIAVVGVLAVVLGHYVQIPEETTMKVAGIIISFIIGQGIADNGKEAAKIAQGEEKK